MRRIAFPLLTSLLFSGSYIAGKYTTVDLDPLTTTLLRYLVALVFLFALGFAHGRAALRVARRDLLPMASLGLFGIVGYHYFFFLSLHFTEVANTAIINGLSPVLTSVAAALVIGERLSARNYLGVAIALAGVLLLLSKGELAGLLALDINRGDLLMLIAVASFVVYGLTVNTLLERYSGYTLTLYATAFGVLWLLVLVPVDDVLSQVRELSPASLGSILYMGVFGSGLGYLTFNLSIAELGPTRTSSLVYSLIPIFVALLALAFFAEPVTVVMGLSIGLVLFGLRQALTGAPQRRCRQGELGR